MKAQLHGMGIRGHLLEKAWSAVGAKEAHHATGEVRYRDRPAAQNAERASIQTNVAAIEQAAAGIGHALRIIVKHQSL